MRDNIQNRTNREKPAATPVDEDVAKVPGAFSGTVNASDFPAKEAEVPAAAKAESIVSEELGFVTGCANLLVREAPSKTAGIVTTIPSGSAVMIEHKDSTADFYKVCNAAGIEGFCMKQYIELRS